MSDGARPTTEREDYARRLQTKQESTWKRVLNVQAPYRWNLRRQQLGRTLDLGSGIGRNLHTLGAGSVGVDHNAASVALARSHGLLSYTPEEFTASEHARPGSFDSVLMAHVVEHMEPSQARDLLATYLPYVKDGGKVFFIVPQERGYSSDATHVHYTTGDDLLALCAQLGLQAGSPFSFPFPAAAGRVFTYNETCLLAQLPAAGLGSGAAGVPTQVPTDVVDVRERDVRTPSPLTDASQTGDLTAADAGRGPAGAAGPADPLPR